MGSGMALHLKDRRPAISGYVERFEVVWIFSGSRKCQPHQVKLNGFTWACLIYMGLASPSTLFTTVHVRPPLRQRSLLREMIAFLGTGRDGPRPIEIVDVAELRPVIQGVKGLVFRP